MLLEGNWRQISKNTSSWDTFWAYTRENHQISLVLDKADGEDRHVRLSSNKLEAGRGMHENNSSLLISGKNRARMYYIYLKSSLCTGVQHHSSLLHLEISIHVCAWHLNEHPSCKTANVPVKQTHSTLNPRGLCSIIEAWFKERLKESKPWLHGVAFLTLEPAWGSISRDFPSLNHKYTL